MVATGLCVPPGGVKCEDSKNRSVRRPDRVRGVSERREGAVRILLLRLNLGSSRAASEKTDRQAVQRAGVRLSPDITARESFMPNLLLSLTQNTKLMRKRKQFCPLCLIVGRWLNPDSNNPFSQYLF